MSGGGDSADGDPGDRMIGFFELLFLGVLAFWLAVALDLKRWWPGDLRLAGRPPPSKGEDGEDDAHVVVIVPARNEAEALQTTLPSLLSQGDSFAALFVVDNGSTDETAAVTGRVAARSSHGGKVRLIRTEPTPTGWSGKVLALQTGTRAALDPSEAAGGKVTWLLFTDADIHHRERSIDALLSKAEEGPYELVSVMARLHARTFWERLLIPPFVYFFQLLYPFRRVADPRSRVAAAAGGCILLRAEALRRSGGLPSMKGAIIDDVTLARRVKDTGGRCWLGSDPAMVSVRAYGGFSDIADMVARTAFTQLGYRYELVVATVLFLGLFFVSPPVALASSLLAGANLVAVLSLAAWVIQSLGLLLVVRHQRVPTPYCLTLPASSALFGYMTMLSAWRHLAGRGIRWRESPGE